MKPITFKEQNVTFAKNQPEYNPLPAFLNRSPEGEVISCWDLSLRERIRLLFTGRIWLMMLSFNRPLTPTRMTTRKKEFIVKNPVKFIINQ